MNATTSVITLIQRALTALLLVGILAVPMVAPAQSLLDNLMANQGEPELIEADEAFAVDVSSTEPGQLTVRWKIADDYYMYRSRFAVTSDTGTVGELIIPPGKVKADPTFGDVETYTREVVIKAPIDGASGLVNLELKGQGCNEPVGVCYPPVSHSLAFDLGQAATAAEASTAQVLPARDEVQAPQQSGDGTSSNPITSLNSLSNLLGGDAQGEFLDPDDAFKLNLIANDATSLLADFTIADGYYLYQQQFKFESTSSDVQLGTPQFPSGREKEDEFFGKVIVYYKQMSAPIAVNRAPGDTRELSVKASYQGCAEDGICYPPITKTLSLTLPALVTDASAATTEASSPTAGVGTGTAAKAPGAQNAAGSAGVIGARFAGKTFWGILFAAFGIGVLLTFTPCVLPLIPILTSVIAGQGENLTRARGGLLATVYVLGTAVTYAAIGYVAGATGEQLQAYFQNAWAVGILVAVFVIMALAMFDVFEVQMPGFLQSRLQGSTQNISGGAFGGVFILGLVSALIVGACVSPLLISALTVAIARGDPILGAAMMFAMALGMGVFLIAIGFGAGALVPRAGPWMDRVKQGFGVMLLAVGIYMLGIFPEVPVLLLWAALFIVVAVYLGATQSMPEGVSNLRIFWKGVGTVLLIWGVLAMLGGFAGNRDILNPLPQVASGLIASSQPASVVAHEELFKRVNSDAELDAAFATAKASGRLVMLDYYADWCIDCKRMEATTLVDVRVTPLLDARFDMIQVDVTDPNDPATSGLKKRFGVFGPPAILFFDGDGNEIGQRLYGYRDAEAFAKILRGI